MKFGIWFAVLATSIVLTVGCRGKSTPASGPGSFRSARKPTPDKPVVVPGGQIVGKVAAVGSAGRFVVLTFPIGHMPAIEERLSVYREGLKVGEVKISGPQRDDSIVADITAGDVLPGDEVRR